jgi:hypothetical protein
MKPMKLAVNTTFTRELHSDDAICFLFSHAQTTCRPNNEFRVKRSVVVVAGLCFVTLFEVHHTVLVAS